MTFPTAATVVWALREKDPPARPQPAEASPRSGDAISDQ